MRKTISLVAGALLLSGCTPNAMIEFLYPRCKQLHTSCADEDRNRFSDPDQFWKTDTSHWSGHFNRSDTLAAHVPPMPHVDTLFLPDTVFPRDDSGTPP
jgi:hypothetical protein